MTPAGGSIYGMTVLEDAIAGDEAAFARLVAPLRRELLAHAYRVTASSADAEDAVQDALLSAWRSLAGVRDAIAFRAWLYRIVTNAALRVAARTGPRMLSWDAAEASDPHRELAGPGNGPWVEPFQDNHPESAAIRREHIELAWIAALQRLPATQRAAIALKDVLAYTTAEIAAMLDISPAAVNSALQRARATLKSGSRASYSPTEADRTAAEAFAVAFTAADIEGLRDLLSDDVRFTMPPLPAWFAGSQDTLAFLISSVLATPWRVTPIGDVNGRPALIRFQRTAEGERRGAVMILHIEDGRIVWLATFVEPTIVLGWQIPEQFPLNR